MTRFGSSLGNRAIQAATLLVLLALWYFATTNRWVNPVILPRLDLVARDLYALIGTGAVYGHLAVTAFELATAFCIAAVLGLSVGFWVGTSRYATIAFEPLIAGIYAVPLIIFLPLFILFFGLGVESKIAFGASYAFFPIALNTIGGISQVDQRYMTLARSMKASQWQVFRRVLLPGALPVIVTGLRVGCITGFLSIIGGEMLAGLAGLGSQISRLAEGMNTSQMFAYIVFVIALAFVLNFVLTFIENRFKPVGETA